MAVCERGKVDQRILLAAILRAGLRHPVLREQRSWALEREGARYSWVQYKGKGRGGDMRYIFFNGKNIRKNTSKAKFFLFSQNRKVVCDVFFVRERAFSLIFLLES